MKLVIALVFCYISVHDVQSADIFTIDGSTFYMSYPEQLNWYQALRSCTYNGMYLIDVRSFFENVRVWSVIDKVSIKYNVTGLNVWTSGTDLGSDGQFYWATTGHHMMYTNWSNFEPSNTTIHENCVHYWGGLDVWNDNNCLNKYYYICRDTFDVPIYKSMGCNINARESF